MSDSSNEIQVNVKGPSELKLQITIATDKTVAELKAAIADKSDVPANRQRLIYSGRVLKDDDLLSVYKIQSAHTIHMVKGQPKPSESTPGSSGAASSAASSAPTAQPLPRMQTGQAVNDPLTQLNSHMGFGAMAGLNPFADMGLNQNDPNMMQNMMNNPNFMQQMSSMLANPQIMDQILAMNPEMANNPNIRETLNSPMFREIVSNPEQLRMLMNMSSMMRGGAGAGGLGNPWGAPPAFPAPGVPGETPPAPGAAAAPGSPPAGNANANAAGGAFGANPFFNPALMQGMFGGGGGGGAGGAGMGMGMGMGGWGGFGSPPAPADTRPPEERFQVQLQQLQDMGFINAQQNIRALLATGGNVNGAIEYILSGGGLGM